MVDPKVFDIKHDYLRVFSYFVFEFKLNFTYKHSINNTVNQVIY